MSETVSVLLTGDVLPGHVREAVGAALAKLLDMTEDNAMVLLSGRQTVVKRNLTAEDADRFVLALEQAGASARVDVSETPEATDGSMSPYAVTPGAARSADPLDGETATPSVFGFSMKGRIGRLRYLAYLWVPMGVTILVLILGALTTLLAFLMAPAVLVAGWWSLRFLVMRMHDVNLSGKWLLLVAALLTAIAVLDSDPTTTIAVGVFWLIAPVLLLWPGSKGANSFGPPCGPNTAWIRAGAITFLLFQVGGTLFGVGLSLGMFKPDMFGPNAVLAPGASGTDSPGGQGAGQPAAGHD